MNKHYKFDCGCSFEIAKELPGYKQPCLKFNYYKDFNEQCPAVWSLFEKGTTLGVFQLESNLAKKYCKELKPEIVEHLSALTAILRPGCLGNTDENGISVTQKYCNRKRGKETVEYPIPVLEPILKDTYGLLIYQESSIRLGIEIAGFSQGDADYYLRKAIGVKDAALLFSCEEKFITGCKNTGKVTEDEAKTIFGWIKASARYAFNKSHSLAYGIKAFQEMYLKVHDPLSFYTAKLRSPRSAFDHEDVSNLIYEAKLLDIEAKLPDIRHLRPNFYHDGQHVYFGLSDIRDFGNASFKDLCEVWIDHKDELTGNFFDFAINASLLLSPSMVKNLIQAGAVDFFGHSRAEMLAEFELLTGLTKNELDYLGKIYHAKKAGVL